MTTTKDTLTLGGRVAGKTAKALDTAFAQAAGNAVVLVVCPTAERMRECLNHLAQSDRVRNLWYCKVDYTNNTVYFEGQRGSIRFFVKDHADYDETRKTVRGYPAGQPTVVLD